MIHEPLHILIADDDEADRLFFKEALEEMQIKPVVETVNNGIELMAHLTEGHGHLPHLIFLDLNMPLKQGLECLKEIRNNEKLKDISIAIYSTSDNEKDVQDTFRSGASVYIIKPTSFNMLKQLLYKAVATHLYKRGSLKRVNFILKI